MPNSLYLQMGLEKNKFCKRKHRWMFIVDGIIGDKNSIRALPPSKASRPTLSFKEMIVKHMTEDVYYPSKPDWRPINITVFDFSDNNPVFDWIKKFYDPQRGKIKTPRGESFYQGILEECRLEMYDGCGKVVESWVFQDAWPQSVNFQVLDYSSADLMTCDITLRYSRAYIK